jgi:hypothetical protein
VLGIQGARAQTGQSATGVETFRLAPGGRATVTFEAFCSQFGEAFPASVEAPSGTAPDNVRAALFYARQQGLTGSDQQALQVQYALWQLLGAVDSPRGEQAAQDVVAQAGTTPPAAPQGAVSVVEASQKGNVRLTVDSWQPVGQPVQITQTATDNFYGRGTLTVENTSQQELTLYVTVGTIFPATSQAEQDMVGYATNVQTSDTGVAQAATSAPTATVAATATTAPTTLPNTSGSGGSPLLLLAAALALLAFGGHVARGLVRR